MHYVKIKQLVLFMEKVAHYENGAIIINCLVDEIEEIDEFRIQSFIINIEFLSKATNNISCYLETNTFL